MNGSVEIHVKWVIVHIETQKCEDCPVESLSLSVSLRILCCSKRIFVLRIWHMFMKNLDVDWGTLSESIFVDQ